jgi:predicted TIM-barrel fold metal-dependent hydrolase
MKVIDAHSHLYPRSYLELLKTRTEIPRIGDHDGNEHFVIFREEQAIPGGGRRLDESFWDVGEKVAYMDRVGIDQTVASLGNPWLDPFDGTESADWARRLNAELALLKGETDGRVVALGVLPADAVESAVEIAREVAATATLYGLIGSCHICGLEFDDARLAPLWEELDRSELPLFIHPHDGVALDQLAGYGNSLPLGLGFPFETTIALTKLVFSGVLRRFPKLRLMVAHGGGTLPFLAARLDVTWRSDPDAQAKLDSAPSDQLASLYLDAVLYHPRALHAAAELVGPRRMLFGTDHPFFSADPRTSLDAVEAEFTNGARTDVLAGTALSLFGLDGA